MTPELKKHLQTFHVACGELTAVIGKMLYEPEQPVVEISNKGKYREMIEKAQKQTGLDIAVNKIIAAESLEDKGIVSSIIPSPCKAGINIVFERDKPIIPQLRAQNLVFESAKISHFYQDAKDIFRLNYRGVISADETRVKIQVIYDRIVEHVKQMNNE